MANVHYNSGRARNESEIRRITKGFYSSKNLFGQKRSPLGGFEFRQDDHSARKNLRALNQGGLTWDGYTYYSLPSTPKDYGLRSTDELNKAMENFNKKKAESQKQQAQKGDRDWKNHKYTAKVVGKNGKVRYIYDNPNNGGRTMLNFFQQPKSGKTNLKQSNKSARVQAPKKSGSNIISDGMKAVSGLVDGFKNLPIAKLFG